MRPIVFDAHCDTPVELWRKGERLRENSGQVSLRRAEQLGGWLQFFAFCTPWMENDLTCPQRYAAAYEYFAAQLRENEASIRLCRTGADAEQALADGVCGAFLSIEGAEALDCDPDQLGRVYAQGVRMINPVWSLANALAGSCMTGEGFTDRGLAFCDEARRLGILLDVSHLSDRGFWQLCERDDTPFLASHSCARAVCDHPRNLTDEQLTAIFDRGGAVGLNLYTKFLTGTERAALDDAYRHLDHMMELGGDGHVCLGGDLDGCETLPDGFTGLDDYTKLYEYLRERGYSEGTLRGLFNESLMKVVKQCIM